MTSYRSHRSSCNLCSLCAGGVPLKYHQDQAGSELKDRGWKLRFVRDVSAVIVDVILQLWLLFFSSSSFLSFFLSFLFLLLAVPTTLVSCIA